jgi:hypothetical protein
METFFVIATVLSLLGLAIYAVVKDIHERRMFEYDNPSRRKCKRCGAWHTEYEWNFHRSETWWEVTSQGNDPNCKCLKLTTYKSPY